MSFGDALRFPFQKDIASIVLKSVLVYAIISTIIAFISDWTGGNQVINYLFQYHPLIYVLVLSGYSIDVIYQQRAGLPEFPSLNLKESLWRGLQIFLSSLIYIAPAWLVYLIMNNLMQTFSSPYVYYREAQQSTFMLAFLWIVQAVLGFYLFGAVQVGVIRFALSGVSQALYQYSVNLAYINDSLSRSFGFFLRVIGLIVVYLILIFGIDWLLVQGTIQFVFDSPIPYLYFFARLLRLSVTVFLALSYLFSIARLQLDFAYALDIFFEKAKTEEQAV